VDRAADDRLRLFAARVAARVARNVVAKR
jgi:hypothetical protein